MSSASLQLWEYRELEVAPPPSLGFPVADPPPPIPTPGFTEEQVAVRVASAVQEAEQRWATAAQQQHEQRWTFAARQFQSTIEAFAEQRARYFREAETEVVHLALALARKILAREAALDPDLLHALVRIALDRMAVGPAVKLRLPPADLPRWQQTTAFAGAGYQCEFCPDAALAAGDCIAETDLGIASLGLASQFKELEQGIEDLLQLRPTDTLPTASARQPAAGAQEG